MTTMRYPEVISLNEFEAQQLLNRPLHAYQDLEEAALVRMRLGAKSVLISGEHIQNPLFIHDYWTNGDESFWLTSQRLPNKNYHEIPITHELALNTCLDAGYSLKDAIVISKMLVNRAIRLGLERQSHTAILLQDDFPEDSIDLPYLSNQPLLKKPTPFKQCQLGLYPVVDSSDWLEKLLPLGVKCIQLRIKDKLAKDLEKEIQRSVVLAKKYQATLFVNDYWELAIRLGAQGIHLGQEDLDDADIEQIRKSGLYLGVSTHCYYEVARAHALNPSYIACGPIYSTSSKEMAFQPQGLALLQRWRRTLSYPLVAIGGINLQRAIDIAKSGIEGVALISAITQADDPLDATQQLLAQINLSK